MYFGYIVFGRVCEDGTYAYVDISRKSIRFIDLTATQFIKGNTDMVYIQPSAAGQTEREKHCIASEIMSSSYHT